MKSLSPRRLLLTGGSGYVGSRIAKVLREKGYLIRETSRSSVQGKSSDHGIWRLGLCPSPSSFEDIDSLIHCAYDFHVRGMENIRRVNVEGFRLLAKNALQAGIRSIVLISTISAYEGCPSHYGKAKLEMEDITRQLGGVSIRPGLVFGPNPGGMLGLLSRLTSRGGILPVVGNRQPFYLCHEEDLANTVKWALEREDSPPPDPVIAAHPHPVCFGDILASLAASQGKSVHLVPTPWLPLYLGLKAVEICGIPSPLRSDSLLSMMRPNPRPDFSWQTKAGLSFRPFHAGD